MTAAAPLNDELRDELKEAAIWGMTLVLSRRYRDISLDGGVQLNRFYNDCRLATAENQTAGPNVETLYGFAWIDLSDGAQVLEVPDTADRYYCLQFFDACLQTQAYVGRRTTGTGYGVFLLTGPSWEGPVPDGMTRVPFPTDSVLCLPRMEVHGNDNVADIAEASRLMEGFTLGPLAKYPHDRVAGVAEENATGERFPILDLESMGTGYFDRLCSILATETLAPEDAERLRNFKPVGISPGATPSADPDIAPLLVPALQAAIAEVREVQPMIPLGQGQWITSTAIRDVGSQEPKLRARMNIEAPGFQCAVEAIYAALLTDSDGAGFDGARSYRVHFPPDGIPPVRAFWSLTVYALPGMRLIANPLKRHAIGTNLDTVIYRSDGSLDLLLQPEPPADSEANWLPTAPGPFMLLCRLYEPGADLIEGRFTMPSGERLKKDGQ